MNKKDTIYNVQHLLFEHPVFNWAGKEDCAMNVLVVGDTDYASSFVDLCLETGQMSDHPLTVYWCVENESTKADYVNRRPELDRFICINDTWNNVNYEPYGFLCFKPFDSYLDSCVCDKVRYAFIAGQNGATNSEIAALLKNAVQNNCLSAYVQDESIHLSLNETSMIERNESEYVQNLIAGNEELERMALNTHLIWEGSGNLDYEKAKERFKQDYNHRASVSFVLSVPYKLQSVGIVDSDPYIVANKLNAIIDKAHMEPQSEEAVKLRILSNLEHRRWVIEKVCEGARRLVDKNGNPEYSSCISRCSVNKVDELGKLLMHPCIVHSNEETPLSEGVYLDHDNWDNRNKQDDTLDDLDRMSIELHRTMKRAANHLRDNKKELDELLYRLKRICGAGTDLTRRDYDRYFFCIENIIDYSRPYSFQYDTYEKTLLKSIEELSDANKNTAKSIIKSVGEVLFPLLEANQYKDYKKYDSELIERIPFILTAKNDIHICMSLGVINRKNASNQECFCNVASVTALNATKVTYILIDDAYNNHEILKSKLKSIRNYLKYRGMNCIISILAFCSNTNEISNLNDLMKIAKENSYIDEYEITPYKDDAELISLVSNGVSIKQPDYFDGSCILSTSALINGKIIGSIVKTVPYFEFDSYKKTFKHCIDCEYLSYAEISSFIQVEDMFALMNAQDKEFNYPDCADIYREMWEIYCGKAINEDNFPQCTSAWTKVSNILKSGGSGNMHIENIGMETSDSSDKRIIKKILSLLEKRGYIKKLIINQKNQVSAVIVDKRIKNMFVKAGDILEAYVYYEACRLDWFDDVQTGYKFKWEYDDVTNELDCVLTKDYRSILVECKSTKNPEEGFYLTLDSLANNFGIGYKKVLIMVTDTKKRGYNNYISRGNQLDIITISSREDLMNIGVKLKEIMEQAQ